MILNYIPNKLEKTINFNEKNFSLSSLGTFKNEILEEFKKAKYNGFGDMVYRFELLHDEIIYKLDVKYTPEKRIGFSIPPGMYEIFDINFMLKNLLLKQVKVHITNNNVRLKSGLNNNQTLIFTKKSFSILF